MVKLIKQPDLRLVQRLARLEAANFGPAGLNEWVLVPLIRHGRVFSMERDGEIVGLAQYLLDWNHSAQAYLMGVSIAAEFRGQGLGTELLRASMALLADENIAEVELMVDPANAAAIAVYERKLGFSITGYHKDEYGEGIDRLVMKGRCQFRP
jgi:ribosomal-protein-alanine N-acetyltransferase